MWGRPTRVAVCLSSAVPACTHANARAHPAALQQAPLKGTYYNGSTVACLTPGPLSKPTPTYSAGLTVIKTVIKTVFPWVASRADILYLAARTRNCAAECLHAAHIAALRESWTDWLPTGTPFLPQL